MVKVLFILVALLGLSSGFGLNGPNSRSDLVEKRGRNLHGNMPQCDSGDSQIEQTCDIFGSDGLSWATIDFQWIHAKWDGFWCSGELAGVRCFKGSGFTASRYNKWECMDSCNL